MATSISYRHGTSLEHEEFRGAPSEITVSTDEQTLYVHSGDQERPGTPLARADLVNVETSTIKSKGILDTKLTNFMNGNYTNIVNNQNPELGHAISEYLDLKDQIGIDLTQYAKVDMSNIDTGSLASGRSTSGTNLNLAYANLSNVDSNAIKNKGFLDQNLVDISQSGKEVIIDTIENSSLNYASEQYVQDYVDEHVPSTDGFELRSNKTQYINEGDTDINKQNKYPSVGAVLNYIEDILPVSFAKTDLSNVTDWTSASLTRDIYDIESICSSGGSNYSEGDIITTDIEISASEIEPTQSYLKIIVDEVDETGEIQSYSLDHDVAQQVITQTIYTDQVGGAIFIIQTSSTPNPVGKLAKADLSNTDALSKTLANSTYLKITDAQNTYATQQSLSTHTSNTNNPHNVTKAQVGLGNVDNTADIDKPISTATQTALNTKQATLIGSGTGQNIKTINGTSILGSGNIAVATTTQGTKADNAIQPNANISLLNNDAGFITNAVNDLQNYTLTSALKPVATSGSYNDLTGKPTIPTIVQTYDASSANGMSGTAVSQAITAFDTTLTSRNYIKGIQGGTGITIPKKIAVYQTSADAQAASLADPELIAISLS